MHCYFIVFLQKYCINLVFRLKLYVEVHKKELKLVDGFVNESYWDYVLDILKQLPSVDDSGIKTSC